MRAIRDGVDIWPAYEKKDLDRFRPLFQIARLYLMFKDAERRPIIRSNQDHWTDNQGRRRGDQGFVVHYLAPKARKGTEEMVVTTDGLAWFTKEDLDKVAQFLRSEGVLFLMWQRRHDRGPVSYWFEKDHDVELKKWRENERRENSQGSGW